jgi:hypothetical protein
MSTLTSIREVLDKLMQDILVGPRLPEKVTVYGGPSDDYTKIVETYTQDDEGTVHIDRCVQYKAPIHFISINLKIEDVKAEGEEQG